MTEPPIRSDSTLDEAHLQRRLGVRSRFEKAWQEAARGGPEPDLDSYLVSFNEPDRSWLRGELEKIAEEGRRLRDSAGEHTQDDSPGPVKKATEQSVTVDLAPDTKVDKNQQTADFKPEAKDSAADTAGTLDYAPAPADAEATMDEEPRSRAAAADFSVDDTIKETGADAEYQSVAGYEILGILGRGAMGVVYKARQRGLRRAVALKMILAGGHASDVELARFRVEAEAVGQLQHPNIVQVYEVGEHNGCPFLSLEFINGDSLQKKLGGQPQSVMHSAQMVQVLAQAMDFAHRKGIIHRDLKPANVMLMVSQATGSGESSTISNAPLVESLYGVPKIADFGLAKCLEEDAGQTRSGTILGTPSYMAPEQAEGKSRDVGPLADQYALGAILYEMLTGRPPFRGETVLDTLEQVRKQEPVPPSQLQPKVPRDLETVCLKALQKEPHKRYADCAVLAEDLRRFVAGEPILGRPVSAAERLVRWCRRNPKVAALLGLSAALLIGVTVVSTVSAILVSKERDRAEQNASRAQKAEERATEQASLALNTVGDLVSRVQEKLQGSAAARALRAEIIDLARERVRQVLAQAGQEKTGLSDRILASAHVQMGGIYLSLSRPEDARAEYSKAHVILDRLAQENPESDKARGNLAVALISLGDLKERVDHDAAAARDYYERALHLRQEIHDHPRNGELPRDEVNCSLASSYDKLADFVDRAEARRYRETALQLRQEAVQIAPASLAAKRDLSKSHFWFGGASIDAGSLQEALASYRSCLKLSEELIKDNPKNRALRYELGQVLMRLGEVQLRLGKPEEADRSYREALDKNDQLFAEEPSDDGLRVTIHVNRYGLATALFDEGDTKSALDLYRRLLRFWEDRLATQPKDKEAATTWIMLCSARSGDYVRATQIAEELRKQAPKDASSLVQVAQGYALCIGGVAPGKPAGQLTPQERDLQAQYTVAALQTLRQAYELGYKGWAALETEPDFGLLLKNPDFQAIVRQGKLKDEISARSK